MSERWWVGGCGRLFSCCLCVLVLSVIVVVVVDVPNSFVEAVVIVVNLKWVVVDYICSALIRLYVLLIGCLVDIFIVLGCWRLFCTK